MFNKKQTTIPILILFLFLIFPTPTNSTEIKINPDNDSNMQIEYLERAKRVPWKLRRILKPKGEIKISVKKFEKQISTQELNPVQTGIEWLKQNQNPDGSWSQNNKTEIVETSAVAQVLNIAEPEQSQEYQKSIDWFTLSFPENSDYLAEKVINLYQAEIDASPLPDYLASQINKHDSGFGFQKDFMSDPITSARVLNALTQSEHEDLSVVNYLLNSQNLNGSWSNDIFATNLVLQSLRPYSGDDSFEEKKMLSINYLKNLQSPNGTWQDNLLYTAISYNTLISYQININYAQEAFDYLLANQEQNNFYNKAKLLNALAKPDIELTSIVPKQDLEPNQPATFDITISNPGYINSQLFNFLQEPQQIKVFIDQEEQPALTCEGPGCEDYQVIYLAPGEVLNFELAVKNLAAGEHEICLQIDYLYPEFYKNNNQKCANFDWTGGFIGPRPPEWLGATTSNAPDGINLYWLASQDPVSEYRVYFSKTLGQYDYVVSAYPGHEQGIYLGDYLVGWDYFQDGTEYFVFIIAFDEQGNRGDVSMETSAVPRDNPNNYIGQISGDIKTREIFLDQVLLNIYGWAQAIIDHGYIASNFYPGNYYMTASKDKFETGIQKILLQDSEILENIDFNLKAISGGNPPALITGLSAEPRDSKINLTWSQFIDQDQDFYQFNIYRSFNIINNITDLEPIISLVGNSNLINYQDLDIQNGLDYYYAVSAEDLAGNFNPEVQDTGPAKGNSSPEISNLITEQNNNFVNISYDLFDAENSIININMQYWNGSNWQNMQTVSGQGEQLIGASRSAVWNAKQDFDNFDSQTKIQIIADDRELVNNLSDLESSLFNLDTKNPSAEREINIAKQYQALKISWQDLGDADFYEIYRNNNKIGQTNNLEFIDNSPGVIGDVDNQYYYSLVAVDQAGNKAKQSQEIGEYDYKIYSGENIIALPFIQEGLDTKSDLLNYLEIADSILIWNTETQKWENFDNLQTQESYQIFSIQNKIITFLGQIPEQKIYNLIYNPDPMQTSINMITLPLSKADIQMASDLAESLQYVDLISEWDAENQKYEDFMPDWPDWNDFEVRPGRSYFLGVNQSFVWP